MMKMMSGRRGGEKMGVMRSESEKEKTKIRERQRRAITTNILHGLRKHGGYPLSPRADINQVLRQLASEAGWVVEPDGTTYRPTTTATGLCPVCGSGKRSATPTPTSSTVIIGGGECSTTTSPHRFPTAHDSRQLLVASGASGGDPTSLASPFPPYMYGILNAAAAATAVAAVPVPATTVEYQHQDVYMGNNYV